MRRKTSQTFLKAVATARRLKRKPSVSFGSTKITKSQANKIYFVYKNLSRKNKQKLRQIAKQNPAKAKTIALRTFNDVSKFL